MSRTTVSLSSMQGSSPSLRFVNRHGGTLRRAGWVDFTADFTKVTDIAFTSDFCNNYSHPASPASLYLTSPRPRPTRPRVPYLMSSSPSSRSRVPKSQVPTHPSPCPRPTFTHTQSTISSDHYVSAYTKSLPYFDCETPGDWIDFFHQQSKVKVSFLFTENR